MFVNLSKIITDWAYKLNDGIPAFNDATKILLLQDTLRSAGWGEQAIEEFTKQIIERKVGDDEMIKYKDFDGNPAEMKASSAKQQPNEHPAKQAYDKLVGEDEPEDKSDSEEPTEPKSDKLPPDDDSNTDDDIESDTESETEKQKQIAKVLNTPEPGSDNAEQSVDDGNTAKQFTSASIKAETQRLSQIDEMLEGQDESTLERGQILKKYWNQFVNAKTREERVQAVRELVDNNLIEGHTGGKKIYLSPNTALPYKHLTAASGTSITKEMNKIIKEEGIDVPMRGNSKDRALADMSGKHNEAGVVFYLYPSDDNKKVYQSTQESLKELGGNESKFDAVNRKSAEIIKSKLPEGSEITSAEQVGGIGPTALNQLGIDPKVDPTDLIIRYTDKDGTQKIMKISAKTYTNPNNITMKNSGTRNAGKIYLGDIGKDIDDKIDELKLKYNWDSSMSDEEKAKQKKNFKQVYLAEFSSKMIELSKTKDGQDQLLNMWKDVHGCGQNVHTQVINKKTGDIQIYDPDYYCKPDLPFEVKFDGVKLVINMGREGKSFLQIDMKTEDNGTSKLLFRHRKK